MDKTCIVIFGATGDLTSRKLLPALLSLWNLGQVDSNLSIVCIGRRPYSREEFLDHCQSMVIKQARVKEKDSSFFNHIDYFQMDYQKLEDYEGLYHYLSNKALNYLYYLAVAPDAFSQISGNLKASGIINLGTSKKLMIEKPFGYNLAHAQSINQDLSKVFDESEIYRIDHYLAKEMMMNIHMIRFTNEIFKALWNQDCIANIQISALEENGVLDRGGYYDTSGAIKDMFQSHLLQIVTTVLMDKPTSLDAKDLHRCQEKVLQGLKFDPDDLVLGQYDGYQKEAKVDPNSHTETYMALRMTYQHPCYQTIPIYVRTGKALAYQGTMVVVEFKKPIFFKDSSYGSNRLLIKIGPDEGIYFTINIKKPGSSQEIQQVTMDFCQSCIYENRINTPQAYERLFNYVLSGDQSLFNSWDLIQEAWQLTEKILETAKKYRTHMSRYPRGSLGPIESQDLLAKRGLFWIEENN